MTARFFQKHIRLRSFDYSSPNSFFITICTKNHQCFLGEIRKGIMGLSEIGNTASLFLQQIPCIRPHVRVNDFIVMPNHVHCILDIMQQKTSNRRLNQYSTPVPGSVSVIINQYKGAVKKWCMQNFFSEFEWQPRFYDHVIRNAQDYFEIEHYIRNNPSCWEKDQFKIL